MHFTMYFCDIYMYINTRMKMRNYVCSRILFEGKEDGRGRVCHAAYSVCSIWMRLCVCEGKKVRSTILANFSTVHQCFSAEHTILRFKLDARRSTETRENVSAHWFHHTFLYSPLPKLYSVVCGHNFLSRCGGHG